MSGIRFKLADGSIVDAVKDCDCITHAGPHWLHMDALTARLNAPLATAGGLAPISYSQNELARLREKRYQMERQGIVEILRLEGGDAS